jgi:uncharacterized protein DUF1996
VKRLAVLVFVAAALLVTALPAAAAPAAIITASSTGQRGFVDPIVSPGARSAHEHCFYGAVGVTETETSASLRAKPSTWAVAGNHTGVWIPCVYEDGHLLQPATSKHILLYYKPVSCNEQVPPENTAGVSREYGYRNTTGGGSFSPNVPASSSSGYLVITLHWRADRDLPGAGCFPTIQAYIRLNVGVGPIGNITLGGPVEGVDGAMGPTSMHGDYMWAWDRDVFERFLAKCVRPGVACGTNPTL